MPLFELAEATKSYGEGDAATTALRGITLSVAKGEFVAVMGPSGSGKSTLLHILGLLDRPTAGQYRFAGTETATLPDERLAEIRNEKIGFVFQAFHLLPRTSVLENVLLPLQYSRVSAGERRSRAHAALEQVQMTHRLGHTPAQLSGGEKQRAAIARALVNHPEVILADEPTGNLDSATGHAVMETIAALHKQGHTIVVITHEAPTTRYAERIVTLQDGHIVSDERATAMHPYTTRSP